MARRALGQQDSITDAARVATLARSRVGGAGGQSHNALVLDATLTEVFSIAGAQVLGATLTEGDTLFAGSAGSMHALSIGGASAVLGSDGSLPEWRTLFDATNPENTILTADAGSVPFTSRRDHIHALDESIVPTWTGDHEWTGNTTYLLDVDRSEDSIYINNTGGIGSPPTYRGALTVSPAVNTQRGQVIQGVASQSANLWELRDSSGTLLIRANDGGDLESGSFTSGLVGWNISANGNAEFNNLFVRGELHCTVFVADEMHASAGTLMIKTAFKVANQKVGGDNVLSTVDSSFTLVVDGSWDGGATGLSYIADNDVLRLKFMGSQPTYGLDLYDVYLEVDGAPTSNSDRDLPNGLPGTYDVNVIRRKGGNTNLEIPAGTGGLVWCKVDQGADTYSGSILLTSDLNNAPYIDVFTIADDKTGPWSGVEPAITPRVRMGNLNGVLGRSSDEWGIAAAEDMSDTTKPYFIASDQEIGIYGIAQTWFDSGGTARAQIDPTASGAGTLMWAGPSESDKRFSITGAGSVWVSALTVSAFGNPIFNDLDGLLLLDCQKIKQVGSTWYVFDSRGEKATLTGAIHQEQGHWANNRGLVIERPTTNYITNPSFEVNTTGWVGASGGTISRVTSDYVFGTACAEVNVDGATDGSLVRIATPAASFAQNDDITASGRVKGIAGETVLLQISERNAATAFLSYVINQTITFTGAWQKFAFTDSCAEATCNHLRLSFRENDSDAVFLVDGIQIEKYNEASTYTDGSLGEDYAWSGTPQESTSTRDATQVILDDHAALLSGNTAWSVSLRVQMPYDYDGAWPIAGANYFWEVWKDNDNRGFIYFNSDDNKLYGRYIQGGVTVQVATIVEFSAGDWLLLTLNVDVAGDLEFFVNAESQGTDDCSGRTYINPTEMNLGSRNTGGQIAGGTYQDLAIYDRILTAEEVGMLWAMNRPLIDMGTTEKPGIYILDGEFKIMSSSSGERIEMDSAGIYGYDADDTLQVAWYSGGDDAGMVIAGAGALKLTKDGIETHSTGDADTYNKFFNSDITTYTSAFAFLNLQKTQPDSNTYGVFNVGIRHDADNQTNMSCWFNEIDFFVEKGGSSRAVQEITYDYVRLNSVPFRPGIGTSDPTTSIEDGMIFYRSDTDKLRLRANGSWVNLN